MNRKILEQLEFAKVKEQFQTYLQTDQAKIELQQLEPTTQISKLQDYITEVQEMSEIFLENHHFTIGSLRDLTEPIRRLELEADLNSQELLDIKRLLMISAEVSRFYQELENVDLVVLKRLFEKVETFPQLQGSLQAINDGGFIESFASPELATIRRKMTDSENQVRQLLQDILKKYGDFLSESLIASRNGRSVLPVKNTYRHKVAGVVHDISASGNTVYIEPCALVQLNEEITQLHADERHEITRILKSLSDMLRPHSRALTNNAWLIGHLDFVKAKYCYLRDYKASLPKISADKSIQLLNVRHPLLKNPVPNDLHFSRQLSVIVITGPNTGGKTIMLKTLGLAQIMGQSGLPILADQGSTIAVFNEIFADIGDEQSIEQSLSTFSSHMTNIVAILDEANQDSLVLFDELGAGTDPQEGASLAMAILEQLRLTEIKTMATTHYPELKAYGIETAFVENASMEFDSRSLKPTYHFMQGVPGRSNAFEIARRLGLADPIVNQAEQMTDSDSDVNRIIEELEKQTLESRHRLDHIKEVEQDNLKFNRAVKKLYHEFAQAKDKEIEKASLEAQEIVNLALAESEEILAKLHEASALKPHQIIEAKGQLKKLVPKTDLTKNRVLKKAKKLRQPQAGDDILVTAYGQRGTLLKQVKGNKWEAQVGLIKMTLNEEEFQLVKVAEESQKPKKQTLNVIKRSTSSGPRARLDLRGKRYEEAMQELDAFIDQALVNNMSQVDIIHGIGTGVIREAVTKYLRRHKHVKSFGYAPQNAGGSGCTIANLG
ncbi:endonuclease MutS2 [Streptococcus pseudoporcinus]|uniref:Endonuclease MutS2 n=1 Tax=Streptococcus pseudoporcinus TaxID=361101 RepID=A0A4U9YBP9_9STRE|nr:endonuclease MutS2 [Streptococcus pseudoporcinus]VTS22781.1 DNA mismatch repair protein [Streptococcus pseudoporcinus]VUC70439.1 DNA mismatch repair protein [Streptococcus pseudoporcinus]VUD00336.1 DNA mismatch repair protein [Streptococcus pseudoporcinus]VUD00713.1 DNA mismatch repair protein [Streptococcus pseudoporcinus]